MNLKTVFYYITSLFVSVSLTACSSDEPDPVEPTPSTGRTVLVYMLADNSLGAGGYDSADINEMLTAARAGDLGSNDLIIYHASHSDNTPTLYRLDDTGLTELKQYDTETSSVSIARMRQVISDTRKLASADKYGLILWSHATGWIENGIPETMSATPKSFGNDRGRTMNVTSLARALDGFNFDYIYFDCCFMANIESMYQLRDRASMIAASPTELPSPGMPYHLSLKYLMADNADIVAAARSTFDYYNEKTGYSQSCTMTVVDTSVLDRLASLTAQIYRTATPPDNYVPQHFMLSDCYLYDMYDYVTSFNDIDPTLKSQWDDAFKSAVIYQAATPMMWNRLPLDRCNGLSTYILNDKNDSQNYNYNRLDWWPDVASHLFD